MAQRSMQEIHQHILANPVVAAWAAMDLGAKLLHVEHRHGAAGLRTEADWDDWHAEAHRAKLAHSHVGEVASPGSGTAAQPIPPGTRSVAPTASPQGAERVPPPTPTETEKSAAWATDIRNQDFEERSRGTTTIIGDDDFWTYEEVFPYG